MSDAAPPPLPPPPPPGYGYGPQQPAGPPPPNYLVLAIVSLLCCWPIGIPAVVFAARVNSKWAQGDAAGAADASGKARTFAIAALVLGVVGGILVAIVRGMAASTTG